MRTILGFAITLSVAVALILSQRHAPIGPFSGLTLASWVGPSTFVLLGVTAIRYDLPYAVLAALLSGIAVGAVACAVIIAHEYPVTVQLVFIVLALIASYPLGGIAASLLSVLTRRVFLVRFWLAAFVGWESTRSAVIGMVGLITGHYNHALDAFSSEMLFGALIACIYAPLACLLLWLVSRDGYRDPL